LAGEVAGEQAEKKAVFKQPLSWTLTVLLPTPLALPRGFFLKNLIH
jgi:hypothetical protein